MFIPDSLTKNANAVKRFEELRINIKSDGKAIIKHKYAITILNEEGAEYSEYYNFYNKLEDLSNISGSLFDAFGKKQKNVKKKDIGDVSYKDGFSLMRDDRIKRHNFYCSQYPYTVEYEDEQELDGIFFLPHWQPMSDEDYAVQQSKFIVETPANYNLRYKQFNYPGNPTITTNSNRNIYTWEIKNTKGIKHEILSPPFNELSPGVYTAPTEFEIAGYKGNMSSWQNLGQFILSLNKGRDQLPENVKQDVHNLVNGITDTKQKVDLLYHYLQNNTRYVNISLGIGGWQPFDANYVAANRYGDCKALSNYMVSLLKEANIKANYVLVKSGNVSKGLWEDFPAPYFTHVIVCVPNGKDSIWLECTSQTDATGFMGSFTGNRKALLIDEDGGHVVNTPVYTSKDNVQLRKVNATIDETGSLTAEVNTYFSGIEQELQHSLIHDANKEQRDKYLNRALNLPTYAVDKYDYKETQAPVPSVDEYLHITSPGYASITGKRLFLQPNLFNKSQIKLSKDEERKYNIEYPFASAETDSIEITVPAGYTPESIPSNVSIENKFGRYSLSFKVTNNKIEVVRKQIVDKNVFPPSEYTELVKFYDNMYKADRSKIVFVKKEG